MLRLINSYYITFIFIVVSQSSRGALMSTSGTNTITIQKIIRCFSSSDITAIVQSNRKINICIYMKSLNEQSNRISLHVIDDKK